MRQAAERQAWTEFVEGREAAPIQQPRVTKIQFFVDYKPAPQGSMKAIPITTRQGKAGAIVKCDNPQTLPYRERVGWCALEARAKAGVHDLFADHEIPVRVAYTFVFQRPKSAPKTRTRPIVKPDYDKLARSTTDALTGIFYKDDCQVVDCEIHKIYGETEGAHIVVEIVEEEAR